jgi:hypothetical protein
MPAGLDAAYWDGEKGAVKWEDLNKHLAELRTAKAEFDNARSVVPETPDKYEFKLPEGFTPPEGLQLDPNDARLPEVRKLAHEAGLNQKQFEALIRMDAQIKAQEMQAFQATLKAEQQKLGPDGGKARVEAVTRGLTAQVGEAGAKHLVPMMVSAAQVQAFEQLLSKIGNQGTATAGYAPGQGTPQKGISEEEWGKLSPTEKFAYARERRAG